MGIEMKILFLAITFLRLVGNEANLISANSVIIIFQKYLHIYVICKFVIC